ncbi:YidB family protein [Catelliglobosispora koreensis]|uniref:YidB family protein n=1 Tax=Catelliglobosispora koreensis TaxID=129052 RepID=UPI00037D895E|nr:YidB family protein [Catelliglobosispora koreensis]
MDLNQIMQLAQNPQVQQLLKGLLNQFMSGKGGGQANLQGLVSQLQQSGLGDQVNSWVAGGPNQEVSGKQIQEALGAGTLDQLAAQAGLPPEQAADDLAALLPEVVNAATPNGSMPQPAAPAAGAGAAPQLDIDDLLKQLLGGLSQPKQ